MRLQAVSIAGSIGRLILSRSVYLPFNSTTHLFLSAEGRLRPIGCDLSFAPVTPQANFIVARAALCRLRSDKHLSKHFVLDTEFHLEYSCSQLRCRERPKESRP
jgi:hypothetical protein